MLVVVGGVDGEHQLLHQAGVQDLLDQLRRVGAQTDVPHHAGLLHFQQVVQHAVFLVCLPVPLLVQAVDHAEVDVVGPQLLQLPVHLALDGVQVRGPAVLPALIVGAEVDLIEQLPPHGAEGRPHIGEGPGSGGGEIQVVDPVLIGVGQRGCRLLFRGIKNGAGADANDTDLVPGLGVNSVFH